MDTTNTHSEAIDSILTLSELADRLHVPTQTLYDLRSQGRGPHGFRVGRELRFRASEIDAWLTGMEAADAARHPAAHREPA
ncbi:MAG TPA: helix-turn-helix domain-containing protein [Nocardioides sp.]|nr:helix-turn-helix domain-containing protein [Nocardioides sp.]